MSKRDASGSTSRVRKRRKNGITSSSSVLDVFDTLPNKPQLMRIQHTNTADPTTSRQSVVQIPSEPPTEEANTESVGEASDIFVSLASAAPVRPKRKKGNNNSVSHDSVTPYGS